MQRREHKVARERGLDRHLGRLAVANLSHHHHVGVGTQDRAKRRREREPGALVDLHLVDPGEPILDRILDRDDVDLGAVDLVQRGEERRRLTGTRRAGDEECTRRPLDDLAQLLLHRLGESELRQRRRLLRLVEQTHDDRLALDGRQHRDTDVEQTAGGRRVQRDAAVLRLSPLRDVELRENLQARGHAGGHPLRDALHLLQHAVDAEPDDERVLLRDEVDVRGPVLGRLEEHRVHEPHQRRIRDAVVDLEVGRILLDDRKLFVRLLDRGARAERLGGARELPDLDLDVLAGRDADVQLELRREAQHVDRLDVRRICDRKLEHVALDRVRDRDGLLEDVERDGLDRVFADAGEREVDERELVARGEHPRDALRRGDALVDERLRERAALLRAAADERELVGRDELRR